MSRERDAWLNCFSLSSCRANSHSMFFLSTKLGVRSPVFKKEIHFYALNLSVFLSLFLCLCVFVCMCVGLCTCECGCPWSSGRETFMSCPMSTRKQSQVFCQNSKYSKSPSHPFNLSPFIFKAFLPCQEQPEFRSLFSWQPTYLKDPPVFICSVANST